MKLPEFVLLDIIESGIAYLKEDFNQAQNEKDTMLYYLFGEQRGGGVDLYEEAIKIFISPNEDRELKVRLFFDRSRANLPTIHITSPSEQAGPADGIGNDEGYVDKTISQDGTKEFPVYTKDFTTTFNIMITSDILTETLILNYTLKAMLISIMDTLELSGLRNPKISSGDLNLNEEFAPPHVFIKYVGLNFFYELSTIRWFSNDIINQIFVKNGKPNASK